MNNQHPIDKFFKQQLGQSSADVPNDMWDRIAAQRSQKNRKPRFFWMWSSLGVLIAAAAVYLLLPSSDDIIQLGSFQVEQVNKTNEAIASVGQIQQTINASPDDRQQQSIGHQIEKNSSTQTPLVLEQNRPENKKENQFSNKHAKGNKALLIASSLIQPEDNITGQKEEEIHVIASGTQNDLLEEGRILGPHQRRNRHVTATIPALSFSLPSQEGVKLFTRSATRCARFASPFFHLDLEVLTGPAYARQQLSSRSSESDAHLQKRKESESPSLSYTAGVRLAATSHTGLGIKTGLMYSQINDKFEYLVGSRLETVITRDPNGNIIRVDTNFIEAYTAENRNRLKFLEIPLLVGFEGKMGKFRVGVNAGAYLQLFFDAKGQIYSPATEQPINFGQKGEADILPIFDKRASAAWYIGTSISYNLHSRYSIIAEPYFKTFPRALSVPDYDLQQNYWTVGLQLGLKMRL